MLKLVNISRLARNCSSPLLFFRSNTFAAIMEKAIEERTEKIKEAKEKQWNRRKERYNGKFKRRDWTEETEEAKKARLEAQAENPVDRVKRRKSIMLMGYSGVNYCGMQRNIEVSTIEEELLKAMLKNEWINQEIFDKPQQAFFQRAARTDKGVSAARQVVSLKLPENLNIETLNADLPDDIKLFAIKRVTKGFNSKTNCDARTYSYTLPSYIFTKEDEEFEPSSYRMPSERLEEVNQVLSLYLGTKNYHNFTIRKEPHDPSARRYMISFVCEQPFVPDNTEVEFARLKVTGQSFMMHQIRKMVSVAIAIVKGHLDRGFIDRAMQKESYNIIRAPGLGLVLDNVHYTRYNDRYGKDGVHEALTFEEENDEIEKFFRTKILSTIIETELSDTPMMRWVGRLKTHSYEGKDAEKDESDKDGYESD